MATSAEQIRAYRGPALFSFGFRPFFLLGAIWAAVSVPLWILTYALGPDTLPVRAGLAFHVHELVFGYGSAIVAGFLLTAIPNWTGRLPVCGAPLILLVVIWLAGRIMMLLQPGPAWLPAIVEPAFLVLFALVVWREVIAGKNTRNLKVAAAVTVMALANVAFHWASLNAGGLPQTAIRTGLAVLVFLILLIGGRITPSFTRNWLARQGGPLPEPAGRFDSVALAVSLLSLAAWSALGPSPMSGGALLVAGILNGVRLSRWRGERTLAEPLVLILHVGYAWAALALVLMGLNGLLPSHVPSVAGLHAAGVGAVGVMTLAVMTRSSLGHTGRALTAGSGTCLIYVLINLAAGTRVAAAFMEYPAQMQANYAAAVFWSTAFVGFALLYGPRLLAPRPASSA